MPGIRIREGESVEGALRKFKRQCERAGIVAEVRKRQAYEKPSIKSKKKAVAARKRALKQLRRIRQGGTSSSSSSSSRES